MGNLLIFKWITAHPPVSFLKKCTPSQKALEFSPELRSE